MASVNTWKQTELVAISGLQIHFVPKKKREDGRDELLIVVVTLDSGIRRDLCLVLEVIVSECHVWQCYYMCVRCVLRR